MPKPSKLFQQSPDAWLDDQLGSISDLSDDEKATAKKIFSNPTLKKNFATQFVDVPTMQSQLDSTRSQYQTQVDTLTQHNLGWQGAYAKLARDYGDVEALRDAGFDVDDLEDLPGTRGGVRNTRTGETFTRRQLEQHVRDAENRVRGDMGKIHEFNLNYATFLAEYAPRYTREYGEDFPAQAFREFAFEHREEFSGKNAFKDAYKAFTAEKHEAKTVADRAKWEKDKEAEIEKRVRSQFHIPEVPVDAKPAPAHAAKPDTNNTARPFAYSIPPGSDTSVSSTPVVTKAPPEIKQKIADKYANANFD